MPLERASTRKLSKRDESQTLTSSNHQTLTLDDFDTSRSQETVISENGRDTLTIGPAQPRAPEKTRHQPDLSPRIDVAEVDVAEEVEWTPPQLTAAHRNIKRTVDIFVSVVAIIVLSPLVLLIAIAVVLSDYGPVFYVQTRVGRGGRHFQFYKFRTMVTNAEALKDQLVDRNHFQGDVTFKLTHDPRVTRVGWWLRKTSLDELPQLLHVLTGDMTLVGPRPAVPAEVAKYSPYELRRLTVQPGLTCYWQVCGRSDLPFERQIELDLEYIENESLWLDFVLLIRTVPALLLMKGAY